MLTQTNLHLQLWGSIDWQHIWHGKYCPAWIIHKNTPGTLLPIRNQILQFHDWAVNELVSSEGNILSEPGSFLCLARVMAWALPSAFLILVINLDKKRLCPQSTDLNTPLMEQVIVSSSSSTVCILFIVACNWVNPLCYKIALYSCGGKDQPILFCFSCFFPFFFFILKTLYRATAGP